MDRRTAFDALRRIDPNRAGNNLGTNQRNLPVGILLIRNAANDVTTAQTHATPRPETEEFLRRILHEVIAFDPDLATHRHFALTHIGILRVIRHQRICQRFGRPVFQDHLHRIEHRHTTRRRPVEIVAHFKLKQGHIGRAIELGDADALAKITNRCRRISTPTQAGNRRQAGIIPAIDMTLLHQLQQFAFAHHRVGQIEPREFNLTRL